MYTIMLHRTTERTPTANRTAVLPCYQPCFRDTNRASVSPYYQSQYYVTVSPCYRITERTPTLPLFRVTVLANAFLRYCASVLLCYQPCYSVISEPPTPSPWTYCNGKENFIFTYNPHNRRPNNNYTSMTFPETLCFTVEKRIRLPIGVCNKKDTNQRLT